MDDGVTIRLTDDEALVLLEMLYRWREASSQVVPAAVFAHDAERILLETILPAELEKQIVSTFAPNYETLLDEARLRVTQSHTAP